MPNPEPDKPAGVLERPVLPRWLAWLLIVGLGVGIWLWDAALGRRPEPVPEWGWKLLAIFLPTVLALMLRPIPGGAAVLLALIVAVIVQALTIHEALRGYMDPTVWLVLAAYMISRAMIKTGLARRIALFFVRLLGHNTLGLSYALVASDTVLAGMIPSNAARVGGVILPITRSLAELYKSYPGATAGMLGTFLMLTLYQGDVVACALFFTGQASNPLAAEQAARLTGGEVNLHYGNWFLFALAPALVSLLVVPWLMYRLSRPEITRTPEAAAMAREELAKLGWPRFGEWMVILVFLGVCAAWVVSGFRGGLIEPGGSPDIAIIALAGVGVLLLTGVLTWEDVVTEKGAWDVFIWYGGLVQLGLMLNEARVMHVFAETVGGVLSGWSLVPVFVVALLVYFYAHYAFASITAHMVSMFPAFVTVLLALGAPPWLVTACFAFFTNFSAGLTHYGTTPAPIVFGSGYVTHAVWWRTGFLLSIVNVVIWLTVGMAWWKLMGLW